MTFGLKVVYYNVIMEQLVNKRPMAIISRQTGFQSSYEQSLHDAWPAAWIAAAQKNGREFDVIDPDKTLSRTLRSRLSSGAYGVVVLGAREVGYYEEMRLSGAERKRFNLVYMVQRFSLFDEIVPFLLDIDRTIKMW